MKSTLKDVIAILCIISSLYVITGCTKSDILLEDNVLKSDQSLITRAHEESLYYFYDNENKKVHLTLNTENAFLSIKESAGSIKQISGIVKKSVRTSEFRSDATTKKQYKGGIATNRVYTMLSFEQKLSKEEYLETLSDIRRENKGMIIAPYFNDINGKKIGLSNFFYVKLKKNGEVNVLEKMVGENNCIIVIQDEFMPLWYKLSITENTGKNALECSNLFHESGLFAAAEPDLMADIAQSNDPYYGQQWGLAKLSIDNAWGLSTGSNIIVAVIDAGFELNHPDLAANVHNLSYDCQSGNTPQQVRDNHGTAVAGIVGAVKDNSEGIAGVAPNCRLTHIAAKFTPHNKYCKIGIRQLTFRTVCLTRSEAVTQNLISMSSKPHLCGT